MNSSPQVPSVSVKYAANGSSTKSNEQGMRAMQECTAMPMIGQKVYAQ